MLLEAPEGIGHVMRHAIFNKNKILQNDACPKFNFLINMPRFGSGPYF